ncbi:hypothetical protein V7S43_009995 [Phytophthora oleae]|uniref:Uncharacterized protein n=1 Tax=Phytophthora oleae TaxID=2107226 RepID=A0ABD3FD10_9STRA
MALIWFKNGTFTRQKVRDCRGDAPWEKFEDEAAYGRSTTSTLTPSTRKVGVVGFYANGASTA